MNSCTRRLRCAGSRSQTISSGRFDMTYQRLEKVDHLLFADRTGIEPKVEVTQRQPRRDGKLLPIEVKLQHRCLAAWRPGAAAMRLLTQSAFVDEDERTAFVLGFFLMRVQVLRFQVRICSSLRSRAFPTGRCGLQSSARKIFQTWPSW